MLREICVRDFALIDEARVEFLPGLNVLTGETGVGKSLLIGALHLLLGGRASAGQVRTGAKGASVDGVFDLPKGELRKEIGAMLNAEQDDEMLITRTVDTEGRSRCRINGRPVTVAILREVGRRLIEIHGQQDHENLLQPAEQRLLLDRFAGVEGLRGDFEAAYRKAVEQRRRREDLAARREERRRRMELLQHELNEIDEAELGADEEERLESERRLLVNAERIATVTRTGHEVIYEAEGSLVERLKAVARELEGIAEFDPELKEACDACEQCLVQLEDLAMTLRQCADRPEFDPAALDRIERRLDLIRKLKSKHGDSIEAVLRRRSAIAEELRDLSAETEELATADERLRQLVAEMVRLGEGLTAKRAAAGEKLSRQVEKELKGLGMRNGRFEAQISTAAVGERDSALESAGPAGFDAVEFMISPNVGEDLKPLRKIASGGEMSRIMLALKHNLAKADRTPLLVFDEVDANVGGRIGRTIGERLRGIARSRQVFCVTHLPQIASFADQQYRVAKEVVDDRTRCRVERLDEGARIVEIAEMIRGDRSTTVTIEQAREMLDDARSRR
ncbi:MAG: DNA repair protein RecN [Planctomycetes bacterium]|nr:DNA repair protein RecN [Planctomycetota bacterium]